MVKYNEDPTRMKLKAKIEANRISRLKKDVQDDMLDDYKKNFKKSIGGRKEWLRILIEVIEEKQTQADKAYANMEFNGGVEGNSWGSGAGSGTDAG